MRLFNICLLIVAVFGCKTPRSSSLTKSDSYANGSASTNDRILEELKQSEKELKQSNPQAFNLLNSIKRLNVLAIKRNLYLHLVKQAATPYDFKLFDLTKNNYRSVKKQVSEYVTFDRVFAAGGIAVTAVLGLGVAGVIENDAVMFGEATTPYIYNAFEAVASDVTYTIISLPSIIAEATPAPCFSKDVA